MPTTTRLPPSSLYDTVNDAIDYFNRDLFDASLPEVMITLTRKANSKGFFVSTSFHERHIDLKKAPITRTALREHFVGEISLNPVHFNRPTELTYSTLVHEMVHLQQYVYGTPARAGYHNREWAQMMIEVGLIPSDTGKPGGKQTGQKMTHYVEQGGRYQRSYNTLCTQGQYLLWTAIPLDAPSTKKSRLPRPLKTKGDTAARKARSKTKYSCSSCHMNAWAKPGVSLICGQCSVDMEPA